MSPDRRPNFPGLEFAVAEAARRKAAEAPITPAVHGVGHGGHDGGHDEHEVSPHDLASGHLIASAFPNLLVEMADLYNKIGVGKLVYLHDSWPARIVEGQPKVVATPPIELLPDVSYLGVNWDIKSSRKVELDLPAGRFSDRFGRFSKHLSKTFKSTALHGLFIIADQAGTINVVGLGVQTLRRDRWEGNPDLQAEALNRAFEHPMVVIK